MIRIRRLPRERTRMNNAAFNTLLLRDYLPIAIFLGVALIMFAPRG